LSATDEDELRQMRSILLEVAIASSTQTLVGNGSLTFIELYNFKSKKKQNRKTSKESRRNSMNQNSMISEFSMWKNERCN
jgi:hypothetical protein